MPINNNTLTDDEFKDLKRSTAWWWNPPDVDIYARLTPVQFDNLIRSNPGASLYCGHVCSRMTDAQFDYCIKVEPWEALSYGHACVRMRDEQFNYCLQKGTRTVLETSLPHLINRLTDIQFEECLKRTRPPLLVSECIRKKVTPYQKAWVNQLKIPPK
jgi:hypothetical protein